jgi:hypothetical protein
MRPTPRLRGKLWASSQDVEETNTAPPTDEALTPLITTPLVTIETSPTPPFLARAFFALSFDPSLRDWLRALSWV